MERRVRERGGGREMEGSEVKGSKNEGRGEGKERA